MLHPSIVSTCFPASPFVNANCIKSANHEALEWVSILWMRSCWINWIPETVTSMSPAVGWSPMNRHGPHGFQKRANVSHSLGCTMCLGYKKYPPGNQHIPSQGTSEDYFPLPVLVVYVSSLEGGDCETLSTFFLDQPHPHWNIAYFKSYPVLQFAGLTLTGKIGWCEVHQLP